MGMIYDLTYESNQLPFPNLVRLDLSHCPLHMPVSNLVMPFAMNSRLSAIVAPNSGLTGELPALRYADVMVDGQEEYNHELPLSLTLSCLDLDSNSITGI